LDEGSQLSGLQRIVENDANQPESAEDGTEDGAENGAAPATDLPADDSSDA
jgi:DNA gyrase subunit A